MPCTVDTQAEIEADATEALRRRITAGAKSMKILPMLEERALRPLGIHCLECANFVQLKAVNDRLAWLDLY